MNKKLIVLVAVLAGLVLAGSVPANSQSPKTSGFSIAKTWFVVLLASAQLQKRHTNESFVCLGTSAARDVATPTSSVAGEWAIRGARARITLD
jgi:hypothetical protein